jgi:uncharacterized membrane protein YesL
VTKVKKTTKESTKSKTIPFKEYWSNKNFIILYFGIGLLIVGYYLMTISPWNNPISLSISPIVLLTAYLLLIPLSILLKFSNKKKDVSSEG